MLIDPRMTFIISVILVLLKGPSTSEEIELIDHHKTFIIGINLVFLKSPSTSEKIGLIDLYMTFIIGVILVLLKSRSTFDEIVLIDHIHYWCHPSCEFKGGMKVLNRKSLTKKFSPLRYSTYIQT